MNATFGQRVKKLRTQNGWTQPELAARLELSLPLIKNYEGDTRSPSIEKLNRLCDVFGVTSDYLLCRTDDPRPNYVPNEAVLSFDRGSFSEEQLKLIEAVVGALNKNSNETVK